MPTSADKDRMTNEYQKRRVDERTQHHEKLVQDGYEWCPECGETLVWEPIASCRRWASVGDAPIIAGECPPVTRDQLVATKPVG